MGLRLPQLSFPFPSGLINSGAGLEVVGSSGGSCRMGHLAHETSCSPPLPAKRFHSILSLEKEKRKNRKTASLLPGSLHLFYFISPLAFFFFFFFCLFRAASAGYGGSQARGQIGATAAGLHQSHSNTSGCSARNLHHSSWQHQLMAGFFIH